VSVKAVDGQSQLVLLAAGRDQGVELGNDFTISRGGAFIGKVKVIKVVPDLAGAQILYTAESQQIQPGDRVDPSP
jgi:hypothetical protein